MSVRTRITLGTLCVFNAMTVVVVGFVSLLYVDGMAGRVGAGGCWLSAGVLLRTARWLRRGTEWGPSGPG